MRFARDAIITVGILVIVVWLAAYARIHAGGLSADVAPGRLEQTADETWKLGSFIRKVPSLTRRDLERITVHHDHATPR